MRGVPIEDVYLLPTYLPPGAHWIFAQKEGFRTHEIQAVLVQPREEEIPVWKYSTKKREKS
jgi:hypothetical protein